jgi:hypothetical protein
MIIAWISTLGMPILRKNYELNGGGSTMIPLPYIQTMNPVVVPLGSNPCEDPSTVKPKSGGMNEIYSGVFNISEILFM